MDSYQKGGGGWRKWWTNDIICWNVYLHIGDDDIQRFHSSINIFIQYTLRQNAYLNVHPKIKLVKIGLKVASAQKFQSQTIES